MAFELTKLSKLRWVELEEDDGDDVDFLLPPWQVIDPEKNGIKRVIQYKFNEDGNKVKITTTTDGIAGGAERPGTEMRRRNKENLVRVSNLSEDAWEPDLPELLQTFGPVSRVYVAIDQKTGLSRGFGFVNFVNRDDAERAINKLNGYGYDNLIHGVEWATPRSN